MQQLFAAFGVNWSLLIAQVINFGIVLGALWYFLYKPVMHTIEERRSLVAKGVEDAEKAREKLALADQEVGTRLSQAETEAEQIVASAREDASVKRTQMLKDAETRAAQVAKDAAARAAQESEKMRRESEKEIARLAILAAEKVIQKHD